MDTCKGLLLPIALLAASAAVKAHLPALASPISDLSRDAELIFQGKVIDVRYQNSIEGLPHTFVTYQIEDVLKGKAPGKTITLRFIGGVMQAGDKQRRLQVSGVPEFIQGAQDVLMVNGNQKRICPLVRCAEGRFQLDAGYVSDGAGNTLGRDDKGNVRFAINPNKSTAPEQHGDHGLPATDAVAAAKISPFDPASFVAHVRDIIAKQPASTAATVASADPAAAFNGPRAIAEAAPKQPAVLSASGAGKGSAFDQWEAEQLSKNGGNPVITGSGKPQR
ncbi:hypothetical protein HPT27_09500 [Permianibacter sp. IMCC34836]|uniref:hypothetical protein n=1 Tax=Permianibacter fluminis TaxID=2738515 RepID=UPI001557F2EF|nr:hypothetical protein [Permianibacter fluminis]NQD37261.1 hypothetical protein [Permianibacter fluminis]